MNITLRKIEERDQNAGDTAKETATQLTSNSCIWVNADNWKDWKGNMNLVKVHYIIVVVSWEILDSLGKGSILINISPRIIIYFDKTVFFFTLKPHKRGKIGRNYVMFLISLESNLPCNNTSYDKCAYLKTGTWLLCMQNNSEAVHLCKSFKQVINQSIMNYIEALQLTEGLILIAVNIPWYFNVSTKALIMPWSNLHLMRCCIINQKDTQRHKLIKLFKLIRYYRYLQEFKQYQRAYYFGVIYIHMSRGIWNTLQLMNSSTKCIQLFRSCHSN